MEENISSLEPLELPPVVKDAANSFLESDQERLQDILSTPNLTELRVKISALIPEARAALFKVNIKGNVASRAFVDAAVRRWVELHPTEKSPQ